MLKFEFVAINHREFPPANTILIVSPRCLSTLKYCKTKYFNTYLSHVKLQIDSAEVQIQLPRFNLV